MIEWIKQHMAASVAGSVVAIGAATTVIYVVVVQPTVPVQTPPQQQEQPKQPEVRDETALPQFPAKFVLIYRGIVNQHGEWSHQERRTISEDIRGQLGDSCDTTEMSDGYCALTAPYDPKQLGITVALLVVVTTISPGSVLRMVPSRFCVTISVQT